MDELLLLSADSDEEDSGDDWSFKRHLCHDDLGLAFLHVSPMYATPQCYSLQHLNVHLKLGYRGTTLSITHVVSFLLRLASLQNFFGFPAGFQRF